MKLGAQVKLEVPLYLGDAHHVDDNQNQGTGLDRLGNDYRREGRGWEGNPGALRWSFCEVREPRENNVLGDKFPRRRE